MKHTLKAWLVDNTVTVDNKDDKILQLESAGSLTLDDVLEEMKNEDTGLRAETIEHVVNLYHRVLTDLVLQGYNINAGLFYMSPTFRGVVEGGTWDPQRNSIYVDITQGKTLREAIAETSVDILGLKQSLMYISGGEDAATRVSGMSATAGRNYTLTGRMLKVQGSDPSVGVTLTSSTGTVTRLADDMIAVNQPSKLVILIPATMTDGTYTLTVTTQYSGSGVTLKEPRSASCTIVIGEAASEPSTPGGDDEGDGL